MNNSTSFYICSTIAVQELSKRKREDAAHSVETRVVTGCCTMIYTIRKKWVKSTRHEVFLNRLRAALGGFARSKRFARHVAQANSRSPALRESAAHSAAVP